MHKYRKNEQLVVIVLDLETIQMLHLGRKRGRAEEIKPIRDVFTHDESLGRLISYVAKLSIWQVSFQLLKYGLSQEEITSMPDKVRRLILFDILSTKNEVEA